jgi:hypothetical protein
MLGACSIFLQATAIWFGVEVLVYHPIFDLNHGMFRMLRLLEASSNRSLDWDTFRILDLYYLFPHLLSNAQLPRTMTKRKNEFSKRESKYSKVPNPKLLMWQFSGSHEAIARSLVGKGFLEVDDFQRSC